MNWTDILTAISSVIILIGGVIWSYKIYIQQRRKFPKASLSQDVQIIKLTNDSTCIHTRVTIKNTGEVLLPIEQAKNFVYQVLPLTSEMQNKLASGEGLREKKGNEIYWPVIGCIETNENGIKIEPGESDFIQFDSVIPSNVQVVIVYTYLRNIKNKNEDTGWISWGIHDITKTKHFGGS